MGTNVRPGIVTSGLVLNLDAANTKSYPRTGTTWFDLSGNNNSGSLVNGPTFSSANGGTVVFDGTNDYADCGNNSSLSLGIENSISVWVRTNREYPSDTTSTVFRGILGKILSGGGGQQSYFIDWYGTNTTRILRFGIGDSSGQTAIERGNYSFGTDWNNLVLVSTTTNMRIWINGVSPTQVSNTRIPQVLANNLRVGLVFSYWEGEIALVQIYNRSLSATEVQQNYNANKARFGL